MAPALRLDGALAFSLSEPAAEGATTTPVTGTIHANGRHIAIRSDALASLSPRSSMKSVRTLAAQLARSGLTLSVEGPRGAVVTLGAIRRSLLHRLLTGSRHIRLESLLEAARVGRSRGRTPTGPSIADLAPPPTLFPVAPMFGRVPRRTTTTHDAGGGGGPRLIFSRGPAPWDGERQRVFYLRPGVNTIGSGPDADLLLAGVDELQAEVRRNREDEYVLVSRSSLVPSVVNGRHVREQLLRTGSRIQLGSWQMSYFREEFADHGRPYGGRIGGELGHQRLQPRPAYRSVGGDRRPNP